MSLDGDHSDVNSKLASHRRSPPSENGRGSQNLSNSPSLETLVANDSLSRPKRKSSTCSARSSAFTPRKDSSRRYQLSLLRDSRHRFQSVTSACHSRSEDCKSEVIYASTSGKRFVPPFLLLGPVVGILLCTAGAATIMLFWIYSHKLPLLSHGIIYLHEGEEDELNREYTDESIADAAQLHYDKFSSHPTILSMSSIIVLLVSGSLCPMMGLVAYGLAADWIRLHHKVTADPSSQLVEQLPTPLQYALAAQICSNSSVSAIVQTIKHWRHLNKKNGDLRLPTILKRALFWLMVILALQVSIAGFDFVLHETTRAVSVVDVDKEVELLPYSMGLDQSLCPPGEERQNPCLTKVPEPQIAKSANAVFAADDPHIAAEGWLTANGVSNVHSVFTLMVEGNTGKDKVMSYYVHPGMKSRDFMEIGKSIGLTAACSMLTDRCNASFSSFDCAPIGRPELASQSITTTDDNINIGDIIHVIDERGIASGQIYGLHTNPWIVSGVILYPIQPSVEQSGFQHFALQTSARPSLSLSYSYGLFSCSLTVQDIEVSYFNESYKILSSKIASASLARDLSGPLMAGHVTSVAFGAVASAAGRVNQESFSRSLEESLSFNILALAAGLVAQEPVAIRSWRIILAQQYDRYILFTYIALLYTYAAAAVALFFCTWGTSSSCIVYEDESGGRREVPAIVLAQRRLVEPAGFLIASHLAGRQEDRLRSCDQCGDQQQDNSISDVERRLLQQRDKKVARTGSISLLHLFDESEDEERVVVGLGNEQVGFGVWPLSQASSTVKIVTGEESSVLRAHRCHRTDQALDMETQVMTTPLCL